VNPSNASIVRWNMPTEEITGCTKNSDLSQLTSLKRNKSSSSPVFAPDENCREVNTVCEEVSMMKIADGMGGFTFVEDGSKMQKWDELSDGEDDQKRQLEINEAQTGPDGVPEQLQLLSDFDDVGSLTSYWTEGGEDMPFDPSMNCHGTFHVRILRAQRLPCPVGSTVQAVVSLKPWKGRVRTAKTGAFYGPSDNHGVCANWEDNECSALTMVHAYSSDESPVPSIEVDLTFSPISMGRLGFSMGSVSLNCESLLMNPNQTKRKWFIGKVSEAQERESTSLRADLIPLVEMEAMFEPSLDSEAQGGTTTSMSLDVPIDIVEVPTDNYGLDSIEEESTVVQPKLKLPSLPSSSRGEEASYMTPAFSIQSQRKLKRHLLRLKTFRRPASCCVCHRSIMSTLWKQKSFRCEECHVDCCADCTLQVDVKLPCGSDLAKEAVAESIQDRLSLDKILRVVAPVDPSMEVRQATVDDSLPSIQDTMEAVGTLSLVFVRSLVLQTSVGPESERLEILQLEHSGFREGDYYMRLTRTGSGDTVRTQTVQNTGRPKFESEEFQLKV